MKTLPTNLATHVALGTTTLADLLLITRTDAQVYAFTSSDQDVTISGVTYQAAAGLDVSSVSTSAGLSVDNLELTTLDDGSTFTRSDVLAGRWRNATFSISRYNWDSPSDGVEPVMAGTIGEVFLRNGRIVAELRGLQQYLQQPIGAVTSATCRARLGDAACGVSLAGYTYSGALTSVSSKQAFFDSTVSGDLLRDSVILLLHGDGTHGSTTFTDDSPLAATISIFAGAPAISTAQSKFGGASIGFPGTGADRLTTPTGAAYALPGDLCVEAWFRTTSTNYQYIITLGQNPNTATGGAILLDSAIKLRLNATDVISGPAFALNTWYHVAATRSGTTWRLFVNGVSYGTTSNAINFSDGKFIIGGRGNDAFGPFYGFIDDLRITKGQARYTADFSAPLEAFANFGSVYAEDWFTEGVFTFTSGANAGLSQKVKSYLADGSITLSLPMILPVEVGDTFDIVAGCRKRFAEDCVAKFSNEINFQGEPHVPGLDAVTRPPV